MSVDKVFENISLAVVAISSIVAIISFLSLFTNGDSTDMVARSLEAWVSSVGYSLALIVLAASGVRYLTRKK